VFDVRRALRTGSKEMAPTRVLCAHQSAVRALVFVGAPPPSASGGLDWGADPELLASAGHDGVLALSSLITGSSAVAGRTRAVLPALGWAPHAGALLAPEGENVLKGAALAPALLGRGHVLLELGGDAWGIAGSAYHAMVAAASADGVVSVTSAVRSTRRSGAVVRTSSPSRAQAC
jgi:transcription factor C subunit 6